MILLALGVILWIAAHLFTRLAPGPRAKMGDKGKALVAVSVIAALVMIVLGYRGADFIAVWTPPTWVVHINNLLMLAAFWTFGSSAAKGPKAFPANKIRHPQLTAVCIWATAHLLANGDLASIILFGGMLIWAITSMQLINRAAPDWTAPENAAEKTYIRLGVITLVMFSVVAGIHNFLGVWPFPS